MTKDYDAVTARHYAAYRPPLHAEILAKAFGPEERFSNGLDVGCGVGHSTHALARYCDMVTGIDPSAEMIGLSRPNPAVSFVSQRIYDGFFNANFLEGGYDVYTFAGSLVYEDIGEILREVHWLAADKAAIVVYDFDVDLRAVFAGMGHTVPAGNYDHQRNFSGGIKPEIQEVLHWEGTTRFRASPAEVAHLLLSVKTWREGVLAKWGFSSLTKELERQTAIFELTVQCYLTRYLLVKPREHEVRRSKIG